MARCPEVNSSGGEPPFLPPSFPQSGTGFAPPISNFYSEISFIFAVNVLYLSCDCRTRLKKRRKRVSFLGSSAIAAYPRKGTITLLLHCTVQRTHIAAYPRKGAKNSASKKMRSFSFANLNSLVSVGCPSMNGTIAAAVIFSLLRLLHSDKMCYNKANSKHLLQNWQTRFPFIVQFFHNP